MRTRHPHVVVDHIPGNADLPLLIFDGRNSDKRRLVVVGANGGPNPSTAIASLLSGNFEPRGAKFAFHELFRVERARW